MAQRSCRLRYPLGQPDVGAARVLRPLYLNNLLVGGLIMAAEPLLAVLLLRQLRFPPLAIRPGLRRPLRRRTDRPGVRQARRRRALDSYGGGARHHHQHEPVQPGARHLPARTDSQPPIGRTLSAWSISSSASIAIFTALGGLLADRKHAHGARGRRAGRPYQPAAAASRARRILGDQNPPVMGLIARGYDGPRATAYEGVVGGGLAAHGSAYRAGTRQSGESVARAHLGRGIVIRVG